MLKNLFYFIFLLIMDDKQNKIFDVFFNLLDTNHTLLYEDDDNINKIRQEFKNYYQKACDIVSTTYNTEISANTNIIKKKKKKSAYGLFIKENTSDKTIDVDKRKTPYLAQLWNNLPLEEKKKYQDKADIINNSTNI